MTKTTITLYVANLPWHTTEDQLVNLFSNYGSVVEARVIQDPTTGRSRGFGFVELSSAQAANQAISSLNGYEYHGRKLVVCPAKPKAPRC